MPLRKHTSLSDITTEILTIFRAYFGASIYWFGLEHIDCLLTDREFVGEEWMEFLNRKGIRYHIRIRNNFQVYSPRKQKKITAWHLFNNLKAGQLKHYEHIVRLNG